ncbi:hypothetical protein ACS127_16520 [Amphibacillus sp. Q70]|uniref:hypothetical protein n=1 Tax=Amphibacillus sp. Q70 TaxID=3453416 RepID=UPI003F82EC5F
MSSKHMIIEEISSIKRNINQWELGLQDVGHAYGSGGASHHTKESYEAFASQE